MYSGAESPDARIFDDIQKLWDEHGESAGRIVVDVPIGLCDANDADECRCEKTDGELSRRCDDLARPVIGSRSSSVFTAPCREAAKLAADEESAYTDVNAKNRAGTGKGVMQQAAHISGGIVEVDELLRGGDGDEEILLEGHPEVCFRAFNGEPLEHSKTSVAGIEERLSALESVDEFEESHWRLISKQLLNEDHQVSMDDILDGIALALTAAAPKTEDQVLPERPPTDHKDLPMQMVYRASSPSDEIGI